MEKMIQNFIAIPITNFQTIIVYKLIHHAYFLTVNPSGNNLRFMNAANNVAGNTLPPKPYFMNTRGNYYKNQINVGYGLPLGSYVYSSSYDIGEGWTTDDVSPGYGFICGFDSLNIYPGGPNAIIQFCRCREMLLIREKYQG